MQEHTSCVRTASLLRLRRENLNKSEVALLMLELKSKPSLTVAWPAAPSKQPQPRERWAGER